MGKIKPVDGQCGTCLFAESFGYASSPSGPEDGVHCVSIKQAEMMDGQINPDDKNDDLYNQYQKELANNGFMDLWRLEALAEESYRCENWVDKNTAVKRPVEPDDNDRSLRRWADIISKGLKTQCPSCGKQDNIKVDENNEYTRLSKDIYRHICGALIKFL